MRSSHEISSLASRAVRSAGQQQGQPHRTAISFMARNLACRAQVWSSPRLPIQRDELQVLLLEARNMLTRGLIAKGVL
ncbi:MULTISPECIES: hypothetical protein [Comamonas]|uniref:hypothetical protein n=1 Tax=Comamonas TaxID=283 RepID=UPI0006B9FD88|nr:MULTISPECIES: hypothetical protein [Comamonas]